MVLRSLIYGYLASAAAGLAVAVIGVAAGLAEATIVALASPAGMACGLLALAYAWRHRIAALLKSTALRLGR